MPLHELIMTSISVIAFFALIQYAWIGLLQKELKNTDGLLVKGFCYWNIYAGPVIVIIGLTMLAVLIREGSVPLNNVSVHQQICAATGCLLGAAARLRLYLITRNLPV